MGLLKKKAGLYVELKYLPCLISTLAVPDENLQAALLLEQGLVELFVAVAFDEQDLLVVLDLGLTYD
jgi:hypothetical protein